MNISINALERYGFTALAGLKSVKIYLPDDCQTVPSNRFGASSTALPTLKSGKSAYTVPFDILSASLSSQPDTGRAAGDVWTHTVQGRIRRNQATSAQWMWRLQNQRVHILTEDWHGERMWFPLMRVHVERMQEAGLSGKNGLMFTFSRRSAYPGLHLPVVTSSPSGGIGFMAIGSTFVIS